MGMAYMTIALASLAVSDSPGGGVGVSPWAALSCLPLAFAFWVSLTR